MKRSRLTVLSRLVQVSLVFVLAINALSAFAMPTFARQFKHQYGYTPSCHACHKEGGGTPLNFYGQAFKDKGKNTPAFQLISALDSDQDGISNEVEASKKSNPGDAKSTPANKGNWLDLSSLIPKEVQALFPQATAWKPLDAMLTADDIDRAEKLGASLNAADENTIYIPVLDRRPAGTALIFPVDHKGKTFFLIMATDRQLNISQVIPMSTEKLEVELDAELLKSFIGTPLQSVVLNESSRLAASVSLAVKRAGILVYMRLKGA